MNKYIFEVVEEEEEEEGETGEAKVKVGETEYTMDELSSLVADGKFKRDIEDKQNTSLDKINGAYVKLTQEKNTWQEERDDYIRLKADHDKSNEQPVKWTPEQITQAKSEARELGLFSKEEADQYIKESFPALYIQQRNADKMLESMERLEGEITGADGRPKFTIDDVLKHIQETGIKDPMRAYKDKYETELDAWKEKKLVIGKREGLRTETGSTAGGKTPPEVKVDRTNLGRLMREALQGS